MHRGFAKLWRKSLDSNIWSLGPIPWKLWCWCLMRANHKEAFAFGQKLDRGQFITGRDAGSSECYVSPFQWYRGMKKLSELEVITLKSHNRFTIVTVCNYSLYNDINSEDRTTDAQQAHNKRTTSAQQAHTDKNEKNYKNEKNEENIGRERPSVFKKPSVEEIAAYCQERGNTIDAAYFFDYYERNGWTVGKTKMKDWRAAVRTWEKNERNYTQKSCGTKQSDFPTMEDIQ